MFPMLPYANRLANDGFRFRGRDYSLRPAARGPHGTIHGSGWTSVWTIELADNASVTLALNHDEPGDPFVYCARQSFSLSPTSLKVHMTVVNKGSRAMPFGFGWHPWWVKEKHTELRFAAEGYWLEGPGHLATTKVRIPVDRDFSRSRLLPGDWINNCYSGWNGTAEVLYPTIGQGIRLTADRSLHHLMVYSNPRLDAFCVEPQTHAVSALNKLADDTEEIHGLTVLEPEGSLIGWIELTPFRTA